MKIAAVVLVGMAVAFPIQAKETDSVLAQCSAYVGTTVSPKSFDAAAQAFSSLAPKGEFETTAAYEARRSGALGGVSGPLLVSKEPEDRKYFEYDADDQRLTIKSYAFDNTGFDAWGAFYSAGYYGKIEASTVGNIDAVISQADKPAGTYEASNSFGAKATVLKIARTTKAIFERKSDSISGGLFPQADKSPYSAGVLELGPSEAQQLKPQLRLAFVVEPKEPFFVKGTRSVGETTVRNPTDITENFSILIADFRCGLVLDGSSKVLAAYATR